MLLIPLFKVKTYNRVDISSSFVAAAKRASSRKIPLPPDIYKYHSKDHQTWR